MKADDMTELGTVSGWTVATLKEHHDICTALREKIDEERDRRYKEVAEEREKALKIKEEADKAALGLAREIQTYKDEKANQLREQISSERGNYATQADLRGVAEKLEALVKPIAEFVQSQQGSGKGMRELYGWLVGAVAATVAVISALWNHK